jgi:GntR family transcriptional regulator, transcriptional repressor for pyruvate dehydrogenase complex
LGVATVTLREALAVLRSRGLVITRRGRGGGTYVRAPEDDRARTLVGRLRETSVQELRELGDHRKAISGMAAALAAQRAVAEEIADLRLQIERLRTAGTANERRRADTQLSIQIAAAAQSSRLTREESRLQAELGDLLWLDVSEPDHERRVDAREVLVSAIGSGDAVAARSEVERHISADTGRLVRLRLEIYRSALDSSTGSGAFLSSAVRG